MLYVAMDQGGFLSMLASSSPTATPDPRKRPSEADSEESGRHSRPRSTTPTRTAGAEAVPADGGPVPNGSGCGVALGGDVNGPLRVPFPREPGAGLSNPKGTPADQHRETAPAGCGSRWGTVSMPPRPKDPDGEDPNVEHAGLCQHQLLWRPCPRTCGLLLQLVLRCQLFAKILDLCP